MSPIFSGSAWESARSPDRDQTAAWPTPAGRSEAEITDSANRLQGGCSRSRARGCLSRRSRTGRLPRRIRAARATALGDDLPGRAAAVRRSSRRPGHRPGGPDRGVAESGPVPGRRSFSTWLYQIVTRQALNKVSRGRVADRPTCSRTSADPVAETAAQTERNLAVDAVTDALVALPFPQRAVVVLHHFEGLSYAEVAAVTAHRPRRPQPSVPRPAHTGEQAEGVEVTGPSTIRLPISQPVRRPARLGHPAMRGRGRPAARTGRRRPRG